MQNHSNLHPVVPYRVCFLFQFNLVTDWILLNTKCCCMKDMFYGWYTLVPQQNLRKLDSDTIESLMRYLNVSLSILAGEMASYSQDSTPAYMPDLSTVEKTVCPICSKSFSCKASRNIHMKIHSGVKPFTCKECGKAFGRKDSLKNHMITHMNLQFQLHQLLTINRLQDSNI